MKHGITEILNEIFTWNGLVEISAKDGREWVDYLLRPWLTRQSEWSVYFAYFDAEDVEEIRIRADERPLIILKKDPLPTKIVAPQEFPLGNRWAA